MKRRFEDIAAVGLVIACIISLCMMFATCEGKKYGTDRRVHGTSWVDASTGPHQTPRR